MYVSVSVILNGVFAPVVHPISLEARLQVTTKPGRSMDIPQALVQVTLKQVTLAISRNQVQSDSPVDAGVDGIAQYGSILSIGKTTVIEKSRLYFQFCVYTNSPIFHA